MTSGGVSLHIFSYFLACSAAKTALIRSSFFFLELHRLFPYGSPLDVYGFLLGVGVLKDFIEFFRLLFGQPQLLL